jgi:hypothetical protein
VPDCLPAVICDVCGSDFTPGKNSQRRCSARCRGFARERPGRQDEYPGLWAEFRARELAIALRICPSGKVRHQRKRDAEKSARSAVRNRYRAMPGWLRVYQCERCFGGFHLTSKPATKAASRLAR